MSMDLDRASIIDKNFTQCVLSKNFPSPKSATSPNGVGLNKSLFLELFDSQLISRHLDLLARKLREEKKGFYTIGSSGHEGNAAIALAFTKEDIAFLHYRSGAFFTQRAKALQHTNSILDQVLSLVASSDDPISGGRHKVFGSLPLLIPPQTSTIASHLPKALGTALSIALSTKIKDCKAKLSKESVVLCSFGDASVNHSTAQGAFNAAQWIKAAGLPLPLVWICEDNGLGISVPTPPSWIESIIKNRSEMHYIACDGLNLADVYGAAQKAKFLARAQKEVVFLHMKTVRLLGHAGADVEFHYRSAKEIVSNEQDDPLLHSARMIVENRWLSVEEINESYEKVRSKVNEAAKEGLQKPKLQSAQQVMQSLIPPLKKLTLPSVPARAQREAIFKKATYQLEKPRHLAHLLNMALTDILLQYPNTVIFGEDVGKKGGVYRITADLQERFGKARVFDTLLDEQTILGCAIGFAHNGFLPIPEIQFLAYTHNAVDQIRGEAATLSFFSSGQYTNPMVIRIPGLAYQQGFGGHFHNDNAIAFLREIPGIIIACPSNGKDAVLLLRKCVQMALMEQRVIIFLEPIALYMAKDYFPNDGLALNVYPPLDESLSFGEVAIEGEISNIVIISYGNGMALSRKAAIILKNQHNIHVQLIDLRWLSPLPLGSLKKALMQSCKVLIVDECRKTGSLSEELITWMMETLHIAVICRITAEDCFIPLGDAAQAVLPSVENIIAKIITLTE